MVKEKYIKPAMRIEVFSLSQTVADNCGAHMNQYGQGPLHASKTTCAWKDSTGTNVFLVATLCDDIVEEDTNVDGWCYNSPSASQTVFGSF